MSESIRELPLIQNRSENEETCSGCETKGCCGALGIRAGAEKEEVCRNVALYLSMGIIVLITAYIIKNLISFIIS